MAETISTAKLAVTGSASQAPAAEAVEVYNPRISVIVRKAVNRKATVATDVAVNARVQDTEGTAIDLTDMLGQGSTVRVRLSVRGPESGQFSITIPDQMDPDMQDSIYGLVEPMDVVEIRMARRPEKYAGGLMPIALRGFVSEVHRQEEMDREGPRRSVVITGQNYAKILNIIRFIYLPTMIPAQLLLSSFKLFLNYGVEATGYDSPAAFITKVVNEVAGEFLDKMRAGSGGDTSPIESLQVDATDSSIAGAVQPFGVQEWAGGSVFDLLAAFGDVGPWSELYVEDRETGPTVVYRPTPFKTAAGAFIQGGASAAEVKVAAADILAISVARTDSNVANYFWVDAPRTNLLQAPLLQLDQQLSPSPALDGYQNASPTTYGIRLMREATQQGLRYDGKAEAEVKDGDGLILELVNEKRRVLIENNKDNAILEAGTVTLKGDESVKPGSYLTTDRGSFLASYYMPEIEHQFTVGGTFLTTGVLERGTGFIERLKRGGADSAYLAELTMGGAYGNR